MTGSFQQTSIDAEVLESNKTILQRRFPDLVSLVDLFGQNWPKSIQVQPTRSGVPTMSVQDGSTTVHVHSTVQPIVEAERWLRAPLARDWDFAVVFGMGMGYHLDALLEERPQCRLVVVEPRTDVFFAAIATRDQRRLLSHPYLELIVTDDPVHGATTLFQNHLGGLLGEAPMYVWPAAARYAVEYLKAFESHLVDLLRATRIDMATRQVFQMQWIDNFFSNAFFAASDPGVLSLGNRLKGRPAIIVAAGPSLEKNVHLLHEAKGKAVIIAAGSAINPLLKHGVEPDLLVSFDAGPGNYRHFEHLHAPELPLVYIPTIFPRIVEEYSGPRFTAAMDTFPFTGWFYSRIGEEKGLLSSGPSVANVAWHLANVLGLNPIILVGQDLAFTDGKTHASGAAHARRVEDPSDGQVPFMTTEGIDGSPVPTSLAMYSMKVWFEQRLAKSSQEVITIDATEGGAKILGTRIMPLKEAIDHYCRESFSPHQLITEIHEQEHRRLSGTNAEERVRSLFESLAVDLNETLELSWAGLNHARDLLNEATLKKLTDQRYREYSARLARGMNRLGRRFSYKLFVEPIVAHVLRSVSLLSETGWKKEPDLYARGAGLARHYIAAFSAINETARRLRRLARSAIRDSTAVIGHVENRLENELDKGDALTERFAVSPRTLRATHIAFYTPGNAGDILLATALRDLFDELLGASDWQSLHAHAVVGERELETINSSALAVIGGGGLFLKDTNPNELSGWQWSCSLDALERIGRPLIVFAVGYNRFRGQDDFGPAFYKFIPRLVDKALFFGLRNHGSIRAIKNYLPQHLHDKVRFQPCMTTVLRFIYPQLFRIPVRAKPFVAVNAAFDRASLRFGTRQEEILNEFAWAIKQLSSHIRIRYFAHVPSDEQILPVFDRWRIPYTVTRLYGMGPKAIIDAYRLPSLVIGMRGHAQMIPFGCDVPILSLISHDKMAWFLEDINKPEWGLEIKSDDLGARILEKALEILNESSSVRQVIRQKQELLWNVTRSNLQSISQALEELRKS